MVLADLGADVVKVETPSGDPSRREGPWVDGRSAYFAQMNRNKRGVVVNPRTPEGHAELLDLVADADVFIENFRPGVLEKMGLGPERIHEINPRCVIVRVSGFGQESALSHKAAFDCIIQAVTGLGWLTGDAGNDGPMIVGAYVIDVVAGLVAGMGALAALQARERTGAGQVVDATMLDAALSLLGYSVTDVAASGVDLERVGNQDRTSAPANAYRATDGWVYVHAGPNHFWEQAVRAAGCEAALADPRFASEELRIEHRADADEVIAGWVREHTVEEIEDALDEAGVPVARFRTISAALADPDLAVPDRMVTVTDDAGVDFRTVLAPLRLSETPVDIRNGIPKSPW
jgi:crotonobetainyl-CoA:carnitine CoA-transferase CaiB-like acyl-CoA transferase